MMDTIHPRGRLAPAGHRRPMRAAPTTTGVVRFARYAYPPNVLGYCGPAAAEELLERVDQGASGGALAELARGFEGAWPYLEILAGHSGRQPLDREVVDAYWIGNHLVDAVPGGALVRSLEDRFGDRTRIDCVTDPVRHGAVLHHSLHVLAVYPWVGLLRAGRTDPSLQVLERCLIRWGTVLEIHDTTAVISVVALRWEHGTLSLGPTRAETFTRSLQGRRLVHAASGDTVAVHWDWICDVLSPTEAHLLATTTRRNLAAIAAAHATPDLELCEEPS